MGLGTCCCRWVVGMDVQLRGAEMVQPGGAELSPSATGRAGKGRGLVPVSLCCVKYSNSKPTLTLTSYTQLGFVTLTHILGGCPAGTTQLLPSPTPALCPEPCSRSFHTLSWSRTSSRLSTVVNPSRWEAPGDDSSCIFPFAVYTPL